MALINQFRRFSVILKDMYKQNQGYGICGAKNIYSSKVKLDNWVEDNIGAVLAQNPKETTHSYDTVQSSTHCPPNQWPLNMPTTQELKAKNKEGMPYSMLFDHGIRDQLPEVILSSLRHFISLLLSSITGALHHDIDAHHHETHTQL